MSEALAVAASQRPEKIDCQSFSVVSDLIYATDLRLDATNYAREASQALSSILATRAIRAELGKLCETIWHPVQNQARSNFKRIYVEPEYGVPYVGSREMFFFPLRPEKFLSKRIPKLSDLMVPKGWLLVSRSGTVGNVLYVYDRLSRCAITDHAIRIEPTKVPTGYLYAFLASKFGQPLISQSIYGSTVDELEPKHLASIPVPLFDDEEQRTIHEAIVRAYELRDQANQLLDDAEAKLHAILGIKPFTEADVEYLGNPKEVKAFEIEFDELGDRFDASSHVPLVRSVIRKLHRSPVPLTDLGSLCDNIYHAPRYARVYVDPPFGKRFIQCSQLPLFRMYDVRHLSASANKEAIVNCAVQDRDLLVTRSGTIGRLGYITPSMSGWVASDDFIRLRPDQSRLDSGYLYAFLGTAYGQSQLTTRTFGGVVDHINEDHVASVQVPELPIGDQRQIGEFVRNAFALRDKANDLEDKAIQRIEHLIGATM